MQPQRPQPHHPPYGAPAPQQWGPLPRPPKRTSPAVLVLAVIGGVLVLLLVVGGAAALLGSGEEPKAADPPAATTAAAAPKADPDAYLAALAKLDPAYAEDREDALGNGDNICQEIAAGKTAAQLARNAALRFRAPPDHGAQLVELTRQHHC